MSMPEPHSDVKESQLPSCQICGSALNHQTFNVREMFFGTREAFEYGRCNTCGCVQLLDIPRDMSVFYPSTYYSRETTLPKHITAPHWLPWVRAQPQSTILDVGCGGGLLLLTLRHLGFTCLTGVEPFCVETANLMGDITIHKYHLGELPDAACPPGGFDLIMMHHSLEHVVDQHEVIAAAKKRLSPSGQLLIRVPLSSSWAFEHFRENWAQWDAPRHLFLHTEASLKMLAEKHQLRLVATHFDSTEFQIGASEGYAKNVALIDQQPTRWQRLLRVPKRKRKRDKATAQRLNQKGEGDQAAFVFERMA